MRISDLKIKNFLHTKVFKWCVILCASIINLRGQNYSIPTFVDTIFESNMVPGYSVASTISGRIFLAPYVVAGPNNIQRVYVLDSLRNLLHTTSYTIDSLTTLYPVQYYGYGTDQAIGISNCLNTATSEYRTLVTEQDSTGQLNRAFYYQGWGSACPAQDGGYTFAGVDSGVVTHLNAGLNPIWSFSFQAPPGYQFGWREVVEYPPTRETTLLGILNDADSSYILLVRLDSNGVLQWAKRISVVSFENPVNSFHLNQILYNGEIYLVAAYYDKIGIIGLDLYGNPLWYKSFYPSFSGSTTYTNNCLFEGFDGNIYLRFGFIGAPSSLRNDIIGINKLTGALAGTWDSQVNNVGFSFPQYGPEVRYACGSGHFMRLNDVLSAGCLPRTPSAGYIVSSHQPYAVFLALQQSACTAPQYPIQFTNNGNYAASFYYAHLCDNPLTLSESAGPGNVTAWYDGGKINLNLDDGVYEHNSAYSVYDLSGRCIKSGIVNRGNSTIEAYDLVPGCYLISVQSASGGNWCKKLMIN